MNDERLVRDMWKELPHREVVGHRLGAKVGARGWVRAPFGLFRRFFERCGLPDPWDPAAPTVEVGLGEVGVAAPRRAPAPHAAPPGMGASSAPKGPLLPNHPPGPRPGATPKAPVDGRPAPRLGESRRDDTAVLKQKSAEAEKAKANPARANLFKVNQPVAKLPMRPDVGADGAPGGGGAPAVRSPGPASAPPPRPVAPPPPTRTAPAAPPNAAPPRPSGRPGPSRMAIEPTRRATLPDGPEEIEEHVPVAARASAYAGFGMDGAWEDDPDERARAAAAESRAAQPASEPTRAPPSAGAAAPPSPSPPSPPSPPRPAPPGPPRPRSAGGLDDLFGMGASGGENTRVRMPKREDADPAKPRRPMVTPDADLKAGAIDRRPPSAKPPNVVPTRGAPGAPDPEGDGGD